MQDGLLRLGVEPLDRTEIEVDTGRHDQAVVTQCCTRGEPHFALDRVHRNCFIAHPVDAVFPEPAVADRDISERLAAAQHEVGERTRIELAFALNQGDFDIGRPHAYIFRRRRTRVAGADYHDAAD